MKKILLFFVFALISLASVRAEVEPFTQKSLNEILPGKQNESVGRLQQALYDFGYYKSEDDEPEFSGRFENDLRLALEDFQRTNNLRVSGRADFATLKTINEFIKYQNEELAKVESTDASSSELEETGYSVEEKNYFADSLGDVTDMYRLSNPELKVTKTEEVVEKKASAGIIDGIFSSILNFFIPSEKYRSKSRQELDVKQDEVKQSKFQNYGYFECIADDDCIKLMNSNNESK